MMNSTDLIIGHFEGSLTPAEASQLDELIKTSPEVRAAFEQQRAIEEGMLEDSEALVPPIGLREATLAAALGGALTTTVGGGIAAWLSTKAAVVLSTLALGGVIVGGIVFSNEDAGEEIETVVAPGQMERVESVDPVGEFAEQEQATTSMQETTPGANSPSGRGAVESGSQAGVVTRTDPNRAPAASTADTEAEVNESAEYELFNNNDEAAMETKPRVAPQD